MSRNHIEGESAWTVGNIHKAPDPLMADIMLAGGLVLGCIVLGGASELYTEFDNGGKITTIEYCLDEHSLDEGITIDFLDCIEEGAPGGRGVNPDRFSEGQGSYRVSSYLRELQATQGFNARGVFGGGALVGGVIFGVYKWWFD